MSLPEKEKIDNEWNSFEESHKLLTIQNDLCDKLKCIKSPTKYTYNPLIYAKDIHEKFIKKYFENSTKKIMFLGMNPGPWGMCQTGIPFGERNHVIEWLKISGTVGQPEHEHPKKKVTGLDCCRSEISGKKFWGFFKKLSKTPENFFKHSFVYNFCPLAFMDDSGKNITPPSIKDKNIRKYLNDVCDEACSRIINEFSFEVVIGIGEFAKERATEVLKLKHIENIKVCSIPHPSPLNVKFQSNWEEETFKRLEENNLLHYFNEADVSSLYSLCFNGDEKVKQKQTGGETDLLKRKRKKEEETESIYFKRK